MPQPPVPVTMTLFGNRVLADIIKLRLGWTLSQYDWCPYKKRRGTDTQGKSHVMTEAEVGVMDLQVKGC